MVEDKYVGLMLAITSTLAIGSSFVITKKGLIDASARHGFEGDGFSYLRSPIWWGGIVTMVIGEVANFAAYAFAPAILVTPLGALSVLIGAVLGAYFLDERLGKLGKLGCATCFIGSLIIILHAPPDKEVTTIDEILNAAVQPGFLFYALFVIVFAAVMIYWIAPKHGRSNPLVYLSICSTTGSISICAVKGLGVALKLTLNGSNQLTHPSTYVFLIVTIVAIMTQMNYFNKALSQFSTNIVNPLYYVTFTTCTLVASFILFQGFNTTDTVNTISLLCGFLVIFSGVYLLNLSRSDPDGERNMLEAGGARYDLDGIPTDAMAAPLTRRSMQARRSGDTHSRSGSLNFGDFSRHSQDRFLPRGGGDHRRDGEEEEYALSDLTDDDEDDDNLDGMGNGSLHNNSGSVKKHTKQQKQQLQQQRSSFDRDARQNAHLSAGGVRRSTTGGAGGKLVDLEDGKRLEGGGVHLKR